MGFKCGIGGFKCGGEWFEYRKRSKSDSEVKNDRWLCNVKTFTSD